MAILPSIPGLEVTVQINDQPLVEHEDDNPNETLGHDADLRGAKTVSKYIQVANEEFTVNIYLGKPYRTTSPSLTVEVQMDGLWVAGQVLTTNSKMESNQRVCFRGSESYDPVRKQGTLHHFQFANIKITTDNHELSDIKEDTKLMSKVGMIEVKVFRTSIPISIPREAEISKLNLSNSEVHEKALKGQAKSHGVIAGKTCTVSTSSSSSSVKYLDGKHAPIANFIFQYRSKEALKQLCIIERTPEPDDNIGSPKSQLPEAGLRKVKRERVDDENVKQEPKRKRSKYKMTIDLTVDSDSDSDNDKTTETIILD